TAVIGAAGGERRRREQALLRMRGASPRRILRLAAAEAALIGIVGLALGLGGAAAAGRLAFGTIRFGGTTGQALVWGAGAAVAGLALSFATIMVPAWRDHRTGTVQDTRIPVGRAERPQWAAIYMDD